MKFGLLAFLFVTLVGAAGAQNLVPHLVVVADAESEIAELETSNAELADRNANLEEQNRQLETDVDQSRGLIGELNGLLGKLSASAGEIYSLLLKTGETEARKKLQRSVGDNRETRYNVESRKRTEIEAIGNAQDQIIANRRFVAINRVRTNLNNQRADFLRACIELTLNQNSDIQSALDNAGQVVQEVEAFLNQ